jgi:hypothetical protein
VPMRRLAAFVVVLGLGLPALAIARDDHHPTFPTCGAFSTSKVSSLVGVGRLHLDHTLVNGTSCTYYGVNAAQASKLATTQVPYTMIKYYPALMIAVTPATKSLFEVQLNLIRRTASQEDLDFGAVAKQLRFTPDEYFYSGRLTGTEQPKCDKQILYDNWVGPPECDGEPALKKVGVVAFISTAGGGGRLLLVSASQQTPPGSLSLSHMLELARKTVGGQLY